MSVPFPGYMYRIAYFGELRVEDNKATITNENTRYLIVFKLENENKELLMPINYLGTYGVRISLEIYRDLLNQLKTKLIQNSKNTNYFSFPILFVYNKNYNSSRKKSHALKIKYLAGISMDVKNDSNELKQKEKIYYILGYSSTSQNKDNKNSKYKLFFSLIVNNKLYEKLKNIDEIEIKVYNKNNQEETLWDSVRVNDLKIWGSETKNIKVFLRSIPILDKDNGEHSYFSNDVEIIHLGAQLFSSKACFNKNNSKFPFIFPIIIPFSFTFTKSPLPRDLIFNVFSLKLTIDNLYWDKIEKLVDWLFRNHTEALVKVLLDRDLLLVLINLLFTDSKTKDVMNEIIRKIWRLESTVGARLFNSNIQNPKVLFISPSLDRILKVYNKLTNKPNDIISLIRSILEILSSINLETILSQNSISSEKEIKRVIGIFVLAYGLHGISHLIMKVLSKLSGLSNFGERIYVNITRKGLSPQTINSLNSRLKNVIVENTFVFDFNNLNPSIIIFSKDPYSFEYFKKILVNKDSEDINQDLIKKELRVILSRNGVDSCYENWHLERKMLESPRGLFMKSTIKVADNIISNYVNERILAPRSLYRYIYERYIRKQILNEIENKKLGEKIDAGTLNKYIQFIIPYHVPQCVDGCYNCVLVERSIKSNMCDMSQLLQEFKTSKWASLCLLKYMGWIDFSWVDCNLS